MPDLVFATLVNHRELLERCLLQSPDIQAGAEVIVLEGEHSASQAFNRVLEEHPGKFVIFVHQDLYLPEGWVASLRDTLGRLQQADPDWGVAGVYGVDGAGVHRGHVYCTAAGSELGQPSCEPQRVRTLDEIVLIVRPASGLRFDPALRGFHLYGTDICLRAEKQGLRSYVIPGFLLHNAEATVLLPLDFWRAYWQLRRRWRSVLPIQTPCIAITQTNFRACLSLLSGIYRAKVKRIRRGQRVADPVGLYRRIEPHFPAGGPRGNAPGGTPVSGPNARGESASEG